MASLSNGSAAASSYDGGNHYPLNVEGQFTSGYGSRPNSWPLPIYNAANGDEKVEYGHRFVFMLVFEVIHIETINDAVKAGREQTKTTERGGARGGTKRRKRRNEEQSRHSGEREEGRQGGSGEGWVRDGTGINIDKANKLKGARGSTACTGSERLSK